MSGSPFLMKSHTAPVYEYMYDKVLRALDIKAQSAYEELQALLEIPFDDLLTKILPSTTMMPVVGSSTLDPKLGLLDWKEGLTELPGLDWCKRIMIGDCKLDVRHMTVLIIPH